MLIVGQRQDEPVSHRRGLCKQLIRPQEQGGAAVVRRFLQAVIDCVLMEKVVAYRAEIRLAEKTVEEVAIPSCKAGRQPFGGVVSVRRPLGSLERCGGSSEYCTLLASVATNRRPTWSFPRYSRHWC